MFVFCAIINRKCPLCGVDNKGELRCGQAKTVRGKFENYILRMKKCPKGEVSG